MSIHWQQTHIATHENSDEDVPTVDKEFLGGCDFDDGCTSAGNCSCILEYNCYDDSGELTSAYTAKVSLYIFPILLLRYTLGVISLHSR